VVLNAAAREEKRKGSDGWLPGRNHHKDPKLRHRMITRAPPLDRLLFAFPFSFEVVVRPA
jgi:hypothetical protein